MNKHTAQSHARRSRAAGFSLVEVLIAMGIFAVGFVSVAAMFPAGALLQKETIADVESQLVARNAAAIVKSKKLTFKEGASVGTGIDLVNTSGQLASKTGVLESMLVGVTNAHASLKTRYRLGDRGYPTAQQTVDDRRYYWVPFLRNLKAADAEGAKAAGDFIVVVFVLRRDGMRDYTFAAPQPGPFPTGVWANALDGPKVPKVIGVTPTSVSGSTFTFNNRIFTTSTPAGEADQVRIGDWIADNNGQVYTVVSANATGCTVAGSIAKTANAADLKIWYAPPPAAGTPSPCTRVLLLTGVIEQKN